MEILPNSLVAFYEEGGTIWAGESVSCHGLKDAFAKFADNEDADYPRSIDWHLNVPDGGKLLYVALIGEYGPICTMSEWDIEEAMDEYRDSLEEDAKCWRAEKQFVAWMHGAA